MADRILSEFLSSLPIFRVSERSLRQDTLHPWGQSVWLKGLVDRTSVPDSFGEEIPVAKDRYIGFLCTDRPVLSGVWHEVDGRWEFKVKTFLAPGKRQIELATYRVLPFTLGDPVDLIMNPAYSWQAKTWHDDGDHDHCALCVDHIGTTQNTTYMISTENVPLCLSCFGKYIKTDNPMLPSFLF